MKPLAVIVGILFVAAYFLMNAQLIQDSTLKWIQKNPKHPDAPRVLLRSAVWCDWTGGDEQALLLYRTIWENYPEAGPECAQALYETAYFFSQGTARRNANTFLEKLFNEYEDQEKWRVKGKELWDEVNHVL
jgi:hypothetical protein